MNINIKIIKTMKQFVCLFVCLIVCFTAAVDRQVHVRIVSCPNHTVPDQDKIISILCIFLSPTYK